jgi:hypothetical protein
MFPFDPPPAIVRLLQPSQQRAQDQRSTQTIELLGKIFTPGVPIDRPDLFSGRQDLLKTIREKFSTKGQNLVIYGQRGLGKTSLVLVAFHKRFVARHTCSTQSTFLSIFLDILTELNAQFSTVERSSKQSDGFEIGLKDVAKLATKDESSNKESVVAKQTLDPNFVAMKLRNWQGQLNAIIIDEFQEVRDPDDQQSVIDTAKILSDHGVHIPIVVIGHAASDAELFNVPVYHEYKGRYFSAIEVKEMPDSELADIILKRQKIHNTRFTPQAGKAIIRIAAGYPTVVHRLALSASIERANQTTLETGWKMVLGGFGRGTTLLDDPTWLVTQTNIYSAVSSFVREESYTHQGPFIELIDFFSTIAARPADDRPQQLPGVSIPTPVLRGAGYAARFYLRVHADPKPFFLVSPQMDAVTEAAVLHLWSDHFFKEALNLAEEESLLPRTRLVGGWANYAGQEYMAVRPDDFSVDAELTAKTGQAPSVFSIDYDEYLRPYSVENKGVTHLWFREFFDKKLGKHPEDKKKTEQDQEPPK